MKSFKTKNYTFFLLGILLTMSNVYGQVLTKTKQLEFSVKDNTGIELNSKYTNIEVELIDNNSVVIEAFMEIEGLSQREVDAYFKKWDFKANQQNNKLIISSFLFDKSGSNLDKHGYYEGYFIDGAQLDEISELKNSKNITSNPNQAKNNNESLKSRKGSFDYEAYIEEGDSYLLKWQKENNEPVGKRWFNLTKEERILLQKSAQKNQAQKATIESREITKSKEALKAKFKKNKLPNKNVRSLSKRATINKILKIKIPRHAHLNINVRHGKVTISEEITNLKADLSYVLLQADKISGTSTSIKGSFTNFEINHWKAGSIDVAFSEFVLIKEVESLNITSNASLVSIDNATSYINAKGNFKMLSVDLSSNIKYANIDVEDSKVVWVKLPKSQYNLHYEGVDSKLIHPKKFSLKTAQNNSSKQVLENKSLKNNERLIKIKALSSVMQIYDIAWDDLKIKSLERL